MNETQISCSDLQCAKIFSTGSDSTMSLCFNKGFHYVLFSKFPKTFSAGETFLSTKVTYIHVDCMLRLDTTLILWVEKELLFKAVTTSMNLKFFNHWEFKVSVRMYSWQSLFTFLFIRLSKVLINFGYFAACSLFSSSGYLKHTSISTR